MAQCKSCAKKRKARVGAMPDNDKMMALGLMVLGVIVSQVKVIDDQLDTVVMLQTNPMLKGALKVGAGVALMQLVPGKESEAFSAGLIAGGALSIAQQAAPEQINGLPPVQYNRLNGLEPATFIPINGYEQTIPSPLAAQ